jgi:hypothetical protein
MSDLTNSMHIPAQSEMNLDSKNPAFLCAELTEQHEMMGCEPTNIRDYQETIRKKYGYSMKDETSKTITLLSESTFTVSPCHSVNNKNDKFISSLETEAKSYHIIHTEIIHSGRNCNLAESSVPNKCVTVLKNPPDVFKGKQTLAMIRTDPHKYDSVQAEKHPYQRQLLMLNMEGHEFTIHRTASSLNTRDAAQSASNICADFTMIKFLKHWNSAINSHYLPDNGSSITHTMLCVSNSSEASASENHSSESDYHIISDLEGNRVNKLINKTDLSISQQIKHLHTNNLCYVLSTILCNKEMPLYRPTSNVSLFNTSYSSLEGDRCQVLETYNAVSKNCHIHAVCIANSNSSCSQHSRLLTDCTSFNERSMQVNSVEILEYSDDREVIHEDNVPFKSSFVLQEEAVTTESEASTSLEQHSLDKDGSELSDIEIQNKIMGADSVNDLFDFTTDSTDERVTGFGGRPILQFQEIRSLSQPSLPTFWLHSSTDDESDDASDNLSETFIECDNIHQENKPKFMEAVTVGTTGKKHTEMIPYNALHAVSHEIAEETVLADSNNQNVHTVQSDHLSINTKSNVNVCFSEVCNISEKVHQKNDKLIFYKETKLSYSQLVDMDTGNNGHEVPFGTTQDSNIWHTENGNSHEMETELSQNINGTEDHANEREYTCMRSEKQHPLLPSYSEMSIGDMQCKVHILSDIANPWNRHKNKTNTEEAERNHSHPTLSACNSKCAQGIFQNEVHGLTLPSDTDINKRQEDKTASQTNETEEEMCHLIEGDSEIRNKYEPCTIGDNLFSPEYITAQEAQILTRPVSPDMYSNDLNQHLSGQNKHTIFSNSASRSIPNCWKVNYQTQPASCPYIQDGHSHDMAQVHDRYSENTLDSYIDMAIKKYENDIHRQSCYTQVKPTRDVTVQTNIKSLNNSLNQNCFLCFNNYNQFNNNGLKDGSQKNLALKRNIEALYLESVSPHKKPRYGNLKSTNLESDIYQLPINLNSKTERTDTKEGYFSDYNNDKSDSEDEEVQDTSIRDVESDHKVPDVAEDISWMGDDMNQKELYMRNQIIKGKLKLKLVFITMALLSPFILNLMMVIIMMTEMPASTVWV